MEIRPKAKYVLLMNWDALRPEMIDAKITPHLYSLAKQGVVCENHHAVFPSCTRVNCASLLTGVYPDKHGIMGNRVYVPDIDSAKPVSNDDYRVLEAIDRSTDGKLFLAETMTQRIQLTRGKTAVVSTGSSGSAFLFDHKVGGLIVNKEVVLPRSRADGVRKHYGPPPTQSIPNQEQNAYMAQIFINHVLSDEPPMFSVLWSCDPDLTQHHRGIRSAESVESLRANDRNLGRLLRRLEKLKALDKTDFFVTSDHGASTIVKKIDVGEELVRGGLKENVTSTDVVVASSEGCDLIYVENKDYGKIERIVTYLQQQDWAGPIFTFGSDGINGRVPGTMSMAFIRNQNARSADILFSFNWGSSQNVHGVRGTTVAECEYPIGGAMHGNFGPYDIRNTLVAKGPDFKSGVQSQVPSGIIDIAPTVLTILGIQGCARMDGRILTELFAGSPDPSEIFWRRDWAAVETRIGGMSFRQAIQYSLVGETIYFDKALVTRSSLA